MGIHLKYFNQETNGVIKHKIYDFVRDINKLNFVIFFNVNGFFFHYRSLLMIF